MKRISIIILVVAFVLSALSVWSMLKDCQDTSFKVYASGIECKAQGDFTPEPYDDTLIAPVTPIEAQNLFCSAQGDIKPEPWPEEEKEED